MDSHLDEDSLVEVEAGIPGMRAPRRSEEVLLAESRAARARVAVSARRRTWQRRVIVALLTLATSGAAVAFRLLERPMLTCGVMRPGVQLNCTAGAPTRIAESKTYDEPTDSLGTHTSSIRCPEESVAFAQYRMTCEVSRAFGYLYSRVGFYAEIGGRCGRWSSNRGGSASVNPRWQSEIVLPPGDWTLSVHTTVIRVLAEAVCDLLLDGHVVQHLDIRGHEATYETRLAGGRYTLGLSCRADPDSRGCLGGPPVWSTSAEAFLLEVESRRR
jgi:hypothetical protein